MRQFNLAEYLSKLPTKLLEYPEGRIELTKYDPLLFALLYLPHHLKSDVTDNQITFSEFHLDLIDYAREWVKPLKHMAAFRDAFIAPRECGKSTWLFLILPLWAAAHEHVGFIAAFADSHKQAEQHLATFKYELDNNDILQKDFPELCKPAMRSRVQRQLADNRNQIIQENGFIFMARGVDSSNLGMKVGAKRPELLILDDIEPGESQYSAYQMEQRLKTLEDVIFPLNNFARVVIAGTTVMPGSIIHQLVMTLEDLDTETSKELQWVSDENIKVHYYPAILADAEGNERSIWPEKWPLEDLQKMRHTRTFLKNFMNMPLQMDGQFWSPSDFEYGTADFYGNTLLSVDPAVSKSGVSDFTGLAVLSRDGESRKKIYVRHASHVKLSPQQLQAHIIHLLNEYPEIQLILIETNQGGDLWNELLKDVPVKLKTVFQSKSKAIRAQQALHYYQKGQVLHTDKFTVLEQEMLAFPATQHDDTLDAVTSGVLYFLHHNQGKSYAAKSMNYL